MHTAKISKKNNRNAEVDFYKGLLMLGVIWGHTITALRAGEGSSAWILTFFRTYDMPFFMLLSGYFLTVSLQKRAWHQVLIRRAGSLLLPLVIWELIIGLCGPLYESLRNFFSLWFLWSLVGCTCIALGIRAVAGRRRILQLTFEVLAVIAMHCFSWIPFNLGYMLPFFFIGGHLKELREAFSQKTVRRFEACATFLFVVMLCFWSGEYNVWNADTYVFADLARLLPIALYRGAIGICGCVAMRLLFGMFYKCFPEKVSSFFTKAGKETMLLYILQSILIEKLLGVAIYMLKDAMGGWNPLAVNMRLLAYVLAPAVAVGAMFVLLTCIQALKKIPVLSKLLTGITVGK